MDHGRSRRKRGLSFSIEDLEGRIAMSGVHAGVVGSGMVEVAGRPARRSPTVTSMTISSGTVNQPITINVTVRAPASAGSPQGTVNIKDRNVGIGSATLMPAASSDPRFAYSTATITLPQAPGNASYYLGRHRLSAQFVPAGAFSRSQAIKPFNVSMPPLTTLSDGVQLATIADGSGPQIQAGQTANVVYTGYLASTGQIFDDSAMHGGAPLSFAVGAGQMIPGFDAGVAGMQAGESRLIVIPPAEGYGSTANGPIPANSTLIFSVTLKSIS